MQNTKSKNNYSDMEKQLYEIESLIPFKDRLDTKVSKVAVAWHLDHMLKVVNKIKDSLQNSNPNNYQHRFNLARSLSFTFGHIPRGKATSPAVVLPPDTIKTKDILEQLKNAKKNIVKLEELDDNANFRHPVFKQLNKRQTIRFMVIHTDHHLKIIRDILKDE